MQLEPCPLITHGGISVNRLVLGQGFLDECVCVSCVSLCVCLYVCVHLCVMCVLLSACACAGVYCTVSPLCECLACKIRFYDLRSAATFSFLCLRQMSSGGACLGLGAIEVGLGKSARAVGVVENEVFARANVASRVRVSSARQTTTP